MQWIDTHSHLYLPAFSEDKSQWLQRLDQTNIQHVLLPNIDFQSMKPMLELCELQPQRFFPMLGLHPCDVKENYEVELAEIRKFFAITRPVAVGEIGIDLYWDKTTLDIQKIAFREQIQWSIEYQLPIVIHARESFNEIFEVLDEFDPKSIRGVFHCFTGTSEQAEKILSYGNFLLGIGGVLTYEKSGLDKVIQNIELSHLVLETDSPFLTPKPYRGKRNESAYIPIIGARLAEIKRVSMEEVASITSSNALKMFNLNSLQ